MITNLIVCTVIMLAIYWGFWKLVKHSAQKREWEEQEREKKRKWEEVEKQYQVEQARKEQERLRAEHIAAKELSAIQTQDQKKVEEQYRLEQLRKEAEKQKGEAGVAEQKRQEESGVAAQELHEKLLKQIEEKYVMCNTMIAAIEAFPVGISDNKAAKMPAGFINDLTFSTVTKRTDMEKLGNFVALDTETTGLKYMSDEIIDIAAIRFRAFQPVAKFSTLLSPSKPIPWETSRINHITDDMVIGCPRFQQVANSLVEFIGDDNIVGHNLPFDLKFIVHYGADVTTKKRKYYDTLAISPKTVKKIKMKWDKELEDYIEDEDSDGIINYKLETLCAYFGIINTGAHRAEGDALAAGILFHKLAKIRKG